MQFSPARRLTLGVLLAAACCSLPGAARAQGGGPNPGNIKLTYRGGPLIRNAKVVTIFWGAGWQGTTGLINAARRDYFNNFFQLLFADSAFMGMLAEYSTPSFKIGNGALVGTVTDPSALPNTTKITPTQIQVEIAGQINAGTVPPPTADTIYFVFTPPGASIDLDASEPALGYHLYGKDLLNRPFAFAVIPAEVVNDSQGNPFLFAVDMTLTASHELAEAVTDPQVNLGNIGWYDDNNGEITDIIDILSEADPPDGINFHGYADFLIGLDGAVYWVEKQWSNKDKAPVAFTPWTSAESIPVNLTYRGGPLVQRAKVATLYWGSLWASNANLVTLFNNFFKELFADRAYMANLGEYSTNGFTIGNGSFATTATDATATPSVVTAAQIESEISAQIDAGKLPAPDADTIYQVFLLPGVVLSDPTGKRSDDAVNPFSTYHSYSRSLPSRRFAYIVSTLLIVRDAAGNAFVDTLAMMPLMTRMLAGTVTDPQIGDTNAMGWFDTNLGEVGDIINKLATANPPRINSHGRIDLLVADRYYPVEKVWSNKDKMPVSFAMKDP